MIDIRKWSICESGRLERFYWNSKTFLNRPAMGPTLSGLFREVVGLRCKHICMGDRLGLK